MPFHARRPILPHARSTVGHGADHLKRYTTHSPHTRLGPFAKLLEELPPGVQDLAQVVRGLLFHFGGGPVYGDDVQRSADHTAPP
ncbi:hypothetical protein [Deinococcus hopiensis]|uniref:hypothetical protein n=1 Tax=Deinococcus hopiensis TaxID=309885 RepID=UPI000A05D9FC|nr:hypothetical protein [Deinococcus hopiensis]